MLVSLHVTKYININHVLDFELPQNSRATPLAISSFVGLSILKSKR